MKKVFFLFCLAELFFCCKPIPDIVQPPNVLFIIVDDLKPELGCYGNSYIKTPNIDKLASQGITFLNAYCQKAICIPSRQSFLTGIRPHNLGIEYDGRFRDKFPDLVTLPQQFKKRGFKTESMGKVFHHRDPVSWDSPSWIPVPDLCYPVYTRMENQLIQQEKIENNRFAPKEDDWWAAGGKWVPANLIEIADVKDGELTDGKIANHAVDRIVALKDDPFFLAVGFFRPHIPFIAPKKYYEMYPVSEIQLPQQAGLPEGAPPFANMADGEWRSYYEVVQNGFPDEQTKKEYIRGYYASVSYVDAQIGKVLDCLDSLNLSQNTIVVLIGDHGYHLFDHASFGKSTNFENGTRVPLIVRNPGNRKSGEKTNAIVELLDIYPSLCDLAGFSIPDHTEGESFEQILKEPSLPGKEGAFSEFGRKGYNGITVRTSGYRYTEWLSNEGLPAHRELYNHQIDPNETVNIVDNPKNSNVIIELKELLHTVY